MRIAGRGISGTLNLSGSVELPDHLFRSFADLVYQEAGISLNDTKRELVRSRLMKRLRALGLTSFDEYYQFLLKHDPDGEELVQFLNSVSTNKTDFFREGQHFDFLSQSVLPALIARALNSGSRRIRFWSAGCSSGEEPYTLAMVLREALSSHGNCDAKILATDISTRVLHTAYEGLYEESKVMPVPVRMRNAYLSKEKNAKGVFYRVHPELKQLVTYRRLNLMMQKYPFSGKFDVIFCRNVMIYFDRPTQEALVNRFYDCLQGGGYLFIGHSESLNNLRTPFQFVKPTIYLRPR